MPSLISRIYRFFLVRGGSNRPRNDVAELRRSLDASTRLLPMPRGTQITPAAIDGIPAEWVSTPNNPADRVILYLHGGYYVAGSRLSHRPIAAMISRAANTRALLIDYRLAPEHPFPAGLEDARRTYLWLLAQGYDPKKIAIMGDSAGGGISAGTILALRDAGDPMPACYVGISPALNGTQTRAEFNAKAGDEVSLHSDSTYTLFEMYAGDADRRNPLLSPVVADLRGFPPTLIHVGTDEMLLNHAVDFEGAARAAGVDVTLKVWDGMWHVWQAYAPLGVPEARQSVREIAEFVQKHLANS